MGDIRKSPKPQKAWGYYNWGRLWGVAYRRKDAIAEIEAITGRPWSEMRHSCEVHKVIVFKEPTP